MFGNWQDHREAVSASWHLELLEHRELLSAVLDTSFGGGGVALGGVSMYAVEMAVDRDGRILVCGASAEDAHNDLMVARFKAHGSPDKSFGTNGVARTHFDSARFTHGVSVASMTVQDDGKIVVCGQTELGAVLVRYLPNGKTDKAFGNRGRAVVPLAESQLQVDRIAAQDDRILIAGSIDWSFAVTRIAGNGSLDRSFGKRGIARTPFAGESSEALNVTVQSDSRILVAGFTKVPKPYQMPEYRSSLARYSPDGAPDRTFGKNGKITFRLNGRDEYSDWLYVHDKEILVSSTVRTNDYYHRPWDLRFTKLTAVGQLDRSYGKNGSVTPPTAAAWGFDAAADGSMPITAMVNGSTLRAAQYTTSGTCGEWSTIALHHDFGDSATIADGRVEQNCLVTLITYEDAQALGAFALVRHTLPTSHPPVIQPY